MHHKDIKRIIKKQLKSQYPNWKRLKRKIKKAIAKEVLKEVTATYDFTNTITIPKEDLLGIEEQAPTQGIMSIQDMAKYIKKVNESSIVRYNSYKRSPIYIKDEELRYIDELLDDGILKRILAYDGYNPSLHDVFPVNMFRAELLKAIKYPEISSGYSI